MTETEPSSLTPLFQRQKTAQRNEGTPSFETRIDRIDRAIGLLVEHQKAITEALCADFGHRSVQASLLTDIAVPIASLKHARSNLRAWMKPQRRKTSPAFLGWLGAQAQVQFQPKGVVGIVSPWNYPVQLTFAPLAGALAAGCRAMIKPSEASPRTSRLMAELFRTTFVEEEIAVVLGGADVGAAFARLPFDHLLFTGGGGVGRMVAQAAAENLVPITLELGGKSPVVVGRSSDLAQVAIRTMNGKLANAGQMCLAPDYALVPEEAVSDFVAHAKRAVAAMYPALKENPDYTSILDARQHDRLQRLLQDARSKGGELVEINPAGEDFGQQIHRKMAPTLLLNPTDEMLAMREEIFGPILPVVSYRTIGEAIAFVNDRPRPLALYYFGRDKAEERRVLTETVSGGVTVNDVVQHVAMEDLPFGGIGQSGIGAYHGFEGFKTFSHAKAVYRQSPLDITGVLRPPYGERFAKIVGGMIRR